MPVFNYSGCRVDDGAVHVEEKAIEEYLLRREGVLRLRTHDVHKCEVHETMRSAEMFESIGASWKIILCIIGEKYSVMKL